MHAGKNSLPAVSKDVFMTTSDKQNPFGCLRLAARSDMFKTKRAAHDKAMPTNGIFHNGTTSDKQILSDVCGLLPEALYLRQNALLMWRPISRTFAVESVWFLTTSMFLVTIPRPVEATESSESSARCRRRLGGPRLASA